MLLAQFLCQEVLRSIKQEWLKVSPALQLLLVNLAKVPQSVHKCMVSLLYKNINQCYLPHDDHRNVLPCDFDGNCRQDHIFPLFLLFLVEQL